MSLCPSNWCDKGLCCPLQGFPKSKCSRQIGLMWEPLSGAFPKSCMLEKWCEMFLSNWCDWACGATYRDSLILYTLDK